MKYKNLEYERQKRETEEKLRQIEREYKRDLKTLLLREEELRRRVNSFSPQTSCYFDLPRCSIMIR